MADKPTTGRASTEVWAEYRRQADRPDRFTRWMLERTLALLTRQDPCTEAPEVLKAIEVIRQALLQPPLPPPQPVDSRVDLLVLELSAAHAALVLAAFDNTAGAELDELQAKRDNPWGGFREAWLEHYNHRRD